MKFKVKTKVELKEAKWDDLKIGDRVLFFGKIGVVSVKDKTLIHRHEYMTIMYFERIFIDVVTKKQKYLRCEYPKLPFHKIVIT